MFSNIGTLEIVIVCLVLFLLFGGKKLPELTRSLINSIKEFREAYKEDDEAIKKDNEKR